MDNYFIVFRVNFNTEVGRNLAKLLDIDDAKKVLRGFSTKRQMNEFANEFGEGMHEMVMLKPVS